MISDSEIYCNVDRMDKRLHDYSHVVADDENVIVEKCVNCGKVIRFNKAIEPDGRERIDDKRYAFTHQVWFMQPSHPEFERYYGKYQPRITGSQKQRKERLKEEWKTLLKEERRFAHTTYYT